VRNCSREESRTRIHRRCCRRRSESAACDNEKEMSLRAWTLHQGGVDKAWPCRRRALTWGSRRVDSRLRRIRGRRRAAGNDFGRREALLLAGGRSVGVSVMSAAEIGGDWDISGGTGAAEEDCRTSRATYVASQSARHVFRHVFLQKVEKKEWGNWPYGKYISVV
jgi:hypothetical protein